MGGNRNEKGHVQPPLGVTCTRGCMQRGAARHDHTTSEDTNMPFCHPGRRTVAHLCLSVRTDRLARYPHANGTAAAS